MGAWVHSVHREPVGQHILCAGIYMAFITHLCEGVQNVASFASIWIGYWALEISEPEPSYAKLGGIWLLVLAAGTGSAANANAWVVSSSCCRFILLSCSAPVPALRLLRCLFKMPCRLFCHCSSWGESVESLRLLFCPLSPVSCCAHCCCALNWLSRGQLQLALATSLASAPAPSSSSSPSPSPSPTPVPALILSCKCVAYS